MKNTWSAPWHVFLARCLAVSLLLHLIAAYFSSGFFHADEHFQLLEFLNWKLGLSPSDRLPIEFSEKMRPWFETSLFYVITRGWMLLGVNDPFTWATSFRFLSAIIGWSSVCGLALSCKYWFKQERHCRIAVLLLCGIWYLPAFHARISSENWGGALFIMGLCTVLLKRVYSRSGPAWFWSLLGGVLFGLAFECRYQIAFMVVGAQLWLWWRAKLSWRDLTIIKLGLLGSILLCTCIDAWGYGTWTIAPWNYIDFNLVRNMVSQVDTDPWWDLFRRAFTEAWPLLGFLVLIAMPLAWFVEPFHVLTWSHLPLFLIHALIGHKELRFLFPLIHAAPIFVVIAGHGLLHKVENGFWIKWVLRLLIVWNGVGLVTLSLMPAWMPIRCLDYIWHMPERPKVIHTTEKNPFDISGIAMNFYRPPGVQVEAVSGYNQVKTQMTKSEGDYWFFYDGFQLTADAAFLQTQCTRSFSSLPDSVQDITHALKLDQLLRHVTNWSIYRCNR